MGKHSLRSYDQKLVPVVNSQSSSGIGFVQVKFWDASMVTLIDSGCRNVSFIDRVVADTLHCEKHISHVNFYLASNTGCMKSSCFVWGIATIGIYK